ncbi:ABC transporter permease [uncultured Campylobacter sp.]|uniref:MlaE family ABC transporter permease n=1 Tax=uncultured Campylobacter sp. TaxID=218934 RepID=UPI002617043F|nr:ABC transporter permease [uncultured Campylobacter sp.]
MRNLAFSLESSGGKNTLSLRGQWNYKSSRSQLLALKKAVKNLNELELSLSEISNLDYFMALMIKNALAGKRVSLVEDSCKAAKILSFMDDKMIDFSYVPESRRLNFLAQIGLYCHLGILGLLSLASFLGEFFSKLTAFIIHPMKFRFKETVNFIKDSGIDALFIVSLTAFLIGIVLAYIGSDMLSKFGASIYIIDIMGALTLREVAPLIAAIVIAGRSASSFTAQIGVMKITEEIDAMRTMGFDPFYFLAMPRIIAMVLIMPLVIFIADSVSIFAQMIVCDAYLDIAFSDYLDRFKASVELRHFLVGMIKAPFFGAFIAIIGCMRGFEVKGNTQSIGEYTTISVVNAIFWVIAIDAVFAVLFSEIGL